MSGHNHALCDDLADKLSSISHSTLTANTRSRETSHAIPLTGWYEMHPNDVTRTKHYYLKINQAGLYLAGWLHKRKYNPVASIDRQILLQERKFIATFEKEESNFIQFHYSYYGGIDHQRLVAEGTLTAFYHQGDLLLKLENANGFTLTLKKEYDVATVSSLYLNQLTGPNGALIEKLSLSSLDQYDNIQVIRFAADLEVYVRQYLAQPTDNQKIAVAKNIDSDFSTFIYSFPEEQRRLARIGLRQLLHSYSYTDPQGGTTRTYWEWLRVITAIHATQTPTLRAHLSAGPNSVTQTIYHYNFTFKVLGVVCDGAVVGGGVQGIHVSISDSNGNFIGSFIGGDIQLGVGPGVGCIVGVSSSGTFSSSVQYTAKNFAGKISFTSFTAIGVTPGIGGSTGIGNMTFYGDGSLPPADVDTSGNSTTLGAQAGITSVDGGVGYLFQLNSPSTTPPSIHIPNISFTSSTPMQHGSNLHFAKDSAELSPCGRQLLREYVAEFRVLFEQNDSTLHLEGHASSTGTEAYNKTLAQKRIDSVQQALKEIVGPNYNISSSHTTSKNWGEEIANILEGDDIENEAYRRVDITLNGSITVSLQCP